MKNQARNRMLCLTGAILGLGLALPACDETVESNKSTTTKKTETPEGTKTTTESTEKTVEKERKPN